jgi:hypothetical protein
MCMTVFVASDVPREEAEYVRRHLSRPRVYQVGAASGCGCGFGDGS